MKQNIGERIRNLRTESRLTQKELSEKSGIDVRTLQRIESSDVAPRLSTLRLLANTLNCDITELNRNEDSGVKTNLKFISIITSIFGLVYLILFYIYSGLSPVYTDNIHKLLGEIFPVLYLIFGVAFYYGLSNLSKTNRLLQVGFLISVFLILIFVIPDIWVNLNQLSFIIYLRKLSVVLFALNGVVIGVGLLKHYRGSFILYKISGFLQLVISLMLITFVPILQLSALWLSLPFIVLLIVICIRSEGTA